MKTASKALLHGRTWVTTRLHEVSKAMDLKFETYYWEPNAISAEHNEHLLMVVGKNKKKAGKIFSCWELENCVTDLDLQAELQTRIFKLLDFVNQRAGSGK